MVVVVIKIVIAKSNVLFKELPIFQNSVHNEKIYEMIVSFMSVLIAFGIGGKGISVKNVWEVF